MRLQLKFMDGQRVIGYIMDAWQKHLNTEADPANRAHFVNGPGNNGGLYGNLVDELVTDLVYGEPEKKVVQHLGQKATRLYDNSTGSMPKAEATVRFEYQKSATVSHTESNTIKTTVALEIKSAVTKATFGVELQHGSEMGTANTVTETLTFEDTIPVRIPAGRVYQLVVYHDKQEATTPYEAQVRIKGTSVANFKQPVKNGEKTFTATAGELCEWINQFNSAGDESKNFTRDPQNPDQGLYTMHGKITADVTHNFSSVIYDVTEATKGSETTAPVVETKRLTPQGPTA